MDNTIRYTKLDKADINNTKELIKEYIVWINIDLSFQNIKEELDYFPKKYQEPEGAFYIAKNGDKVIGCVGMRKINNDICEMKRLFVRDEYKGKGIGKKLISIILKDAKEKGYSRIRLDTLKKMGKAQSIYRQFGFYEIEKYIDNPIEGTIFMERIL